MRGIIADFPKIVEVIAECAVNNAFPEQFVDPGGCGIVVWKRKIIVLVDQADDGLTDHAQLQQAGVRIRIDILFSQRTEVLQHREQIV